MRNKVRGVKTPTGNSILTAPSCKAVTKSTSKGHAPDNQLPRPRTQLLFSYFHHHSLQSVNKATHQSDTNCETEIWLKVRPPEPPCPEGSQRSLGRRLKRDPVARAPASAAGVRTAPGAITVQARPRTQFFFRGEPLPPPAKEPH